MALSPEEIARCAQIVDEAADTAELIPMLTIERPEMTLEEAYAIQRASMVRRFERGERLLGMKMGLTSEAKMKQVGVHEPIYGHLTDEMKIEDGGVLSRARCCHPRSEPELCFILAHDLKGPVTPEEAMKAVSGVCPALEIIDSRYKNFKFTLEDVVADNASSRGFVLGPVTPIDGVDISALPMKLVVNGQTVQEGSSAAIYGHPAKSLAAQANMLARLGQHLEAGQVVMSGGATAAVAVNVGDEVQVVVEGLGTASFRVED